MVQQRQVQRCITVETSNGPIAVSFKKSAFSLLKHLSESSFLRNPQSILDYTALLSMSSIGVNDSATRLIGTTTGRKCNATRGCLEQCTTRIGARIHPAPLPLSCATLLLTPTSYILFFLMLVRSQRHGMLSDFFLPGKGRGGGGRTDFPESAPSLCPLNAQLVRAKVTLIFTSLIRTDLSFSLLS